MSCQVPFGISVQIFCKSNGLDGGALSQAPIERSKKRSTIIDVSAPSVLAVDSDSHDAVIRVRKPLCETCFQFVQESCSSGVGIGNMLVVKADGVGQFSVAKEHGDLTSSL